MWSVSPLLSSELCFALSSERRAGARVPPSAPKWEAKLLDVKATLRFTT